MSNRSVVDRNYPATVVTLSRRTWSEVREKERALVCAGNGDSSRQIYKTMIMKLPDAHRYLNKEP
jgi:hypothetical protein